MMAWYRWRFPGSYPGAGSNFLSVSCRLNMSSILNGRQAGWTFSSDAFQPIW